MEMAGHVALIGKACHRCNFCEGVSGTQELFGPVDAQLCLVGMWRHARLTRKEPMQMKWAEINEGRKLGQRDGF